MSDHVSRQLDVFCLLVPPDAIIPAPKRNPLPAGAFVAVFTAAGVIDDTFPDVHDETDGACRVAGIDALLSVIGQLLSLRRAKAMR